MGPGGQVKIPQVSKGHKIEKQKKQMFELRTSLLVLLQQFYFTTSYSSLFVCLFISIVKSSWDVTCNHFRSHKQVFQGNILRFL